MNKEEFISKCNAVYALMSVKEMLPDEEKNLVGSVNSLITYFTNQFSIKNN